jgi:hypothetical protein
MFIMREEEKKRSQILVEGPLMPLSYRCRYKALRPAQLRGSSPFPEYG